jgi:hypothetical protein
MLLRSKILACLLSLTTLTAVAGAQEQPPQNSDRLRKEIESVNLIYRRTLLRQYEEYIASLKQDIEGVREARVKVGDASAAARELDAGIKRLTADLGEAEAKAGALRAEAGEERAQAASPQVTAPPVGCDRIPDNLLPPGAIWCGKVGEDTGPNVADPSLPVQALAERAAPILWFSPDEPLRRPDSDNRNIPEPLPGTTPKPPHGHHAVSAPVVYFRISRIIDDKIKNKDEGNYGFEITTPDLALNSLNEVTVRYYFYYREDIGFEGHRNDLESLRLDIGFTPVDVETAPGVAVKFYVAHIKTAVGAAHGVSWYDNELDIGKNKRDVSLPLTVLIEEGKHATSPDRNADGLYSPGYDVNRRYNDAWGIRDLIGSGQLGGSHYEGSMTKQRRPDGMIVPLVREGGREVDRAELLKRYTGTYKDYLLKNPEGTPAYTLKRVTRDLTGTVAASEREREVELKQKNDARQPDEKKIDVKKEMGLSIVGLMEREHFDREEPRKTTGQGFFEQAAKVGREGVGIERGNKGDVLDALTFGYRYDGQHGFTISPPASRRFLPFLGGYVLPKLNVMPSGPERHWSLEGLFIPSASRTFDWYISAGPEWFRRRGEEEYDTRFATEGGLRFRFRYKLFIGGRLGIRTTGFRQPRDPRLVFELGPGAF